MTSELEVVLNRLAGVKKLSNGYQAKCPTHNDNHQSLSIKVSPEGKLLLYCHTGLPQCSFENIIKALDLQPNHIKNTPIITDPYDYTDAEGELLYQVVRYQPKAFKQRRPDDNGGWIWDLNGITPTLYHLPEVTQAIADDKLVFIVEGEKDADNLRQYGQVATSISGGASTKWHPSLVPLLEGAKVVIIADNDEAGRKYALYVANLLYGWCSTLKLLTLPTKDVSDFLMVETTSIVEGLKVTDTFFNTIDKLLQIVDNTEEYIPVGAVTRDEFNSFRGVNLYLWQQLRQRKRKPKYS